VLLDTYYATAVQNGNDVYITGPENHPDRAARGGELSVFIYISQ
jgi:hypothetical protein